jgi:hypothetical protein
MERKKASLKELHQVLRDNLPWRYALSCLLLLNGPVCRPTPGILNTEGTGRDWGGGVQERRWVS